MWKEIQKRFSSPDAIISTLLGIAIVVVLGITVFNSIKSVTTSKKEAEELKKAEEQKQVKLPATYTVKEGDTLWGISIEYYKTGYNWTDIAEANALENPDIIYPGTTLSIPDVPAKVVEQGEISSLSTIKPKHTSYTVIDGDSLWGISIKEYETGYKWPDVAEANKIPNPDLIYPGTILQLP